MSNKVLEFIHAVPGMVFEYAGANAPAGFLMCYGQAIVRADYPDLFAAIGTAFGAGNGTTTFNVPDCRGRVTAGKDNMGGTAAGRLSSTGAGGPGIDGTALGAAGGVDRHTLTETQMPSHMHGPSAGMAGFMTIVAGNPVPDQGSTTGSVYDWTYVNQTGFTGGNGAHPNAQPTIVLNKMIKT